MIRFSFSVDDSIQQLFSDVYKKIPESSKPENDSLAAILKEFTDTSGLMEDIYKRFRVDPKWGKSDYLFALNRRFIYSFLFFFLSEFIRELITDIYTVTDPNLRRQKIKQLYLVLNNMDYMEADTQ